MQSFPDMAETHEWTLRRLREMAGRLTEQAYLRAGAAASDDDEAARWMLMFDRMARGLRLTIALEARLARERRWDADEIAREARGEHYTPRWRAPAVAPSPPGDAEPCESDREREADSLGDGLADDAPLAQRIGRLQAIIEGGGLSEPEPATLRSERQALARLRAARAERAVSACAPDEPWDVLTPADRADTQAPPWRGSG